MRNKDIHVETHEVIALSNVRDFVLKTESDWEHEDQYILCRMIPLRTDPHVFGSQGVMHTVFKSRQPGLFDFLEQHLSEYEAECENDGDIVYPHKLKCYVLGAITTIDLKTPHVMRMYVPGDKSLRVLNGPKYDPERDTYKLSPRYIRKARVFIDMDDIDFINECSDSYKATYILGEHYHSIITVLPPELDYY